MQQSPRPLPLEDFCIEAQEIYLMTHPEERRQERKRREEMEWADRQVLTDIMQKIIWMKNPEGRAFETSIELSERVRKVLLKKGYTLNYRVEIKSWPSIEEKVFTTISW
jgi:hypothetical protein